MAEGKEKSLEMRVAEIEDKLSKLHITEDEMKTYQKVAAALGTGAPAATGANPSIVGCVIRTCIIRTCIISIQCINECTCGPCNVGGTGGGLGGSGFGGLGM
jgi:hypothetical protein